MPLKLPIALMKNLIRSSSSLFYVLSILGCSLSSEYKLEGSITLIGPDFQTRQGQQGKVGDDCFTWGRYSDIAEGTEILVKNSKDETLAIGRLSGGKFTKADASGWIMHCTFTFSVQNIPKAGLYVIENGKRGEKQYSLGELRKLDWTLEYSLNQQG